MIRLERYLDTVVKRQCLFRILYLLLTCWIACTYLQTAASILAIHTYDEMYQGLTASVFDSSYLARVVLLCMSMPVFDISIIFINMLKALRFADILFLLFTILLVIGDVYRNVRKRYSILPISYIIQYFLVAILAVWAAQADSFLTLIHYIRGIGWLLILVQVFIGILCLIYLIQALFDYQKALCYDAVEIHSDKLD